MSNSLCNFPVTSGWSRGRLRRRYTVSPWDKGDQDGLELEFNHLNMMLVSDTRNKGEEQGPESQS